MRSRQVGDTEHSTVEAICEESSAVVRGDRDVRRVWSRPQT